MAVPDFLIPYQVKQETNKQCKTNTNKTNKNKNKSKTKQGQTMLSMIEETGGKRCSHRAASPLHGDTDLLQEGATIQSHLPSLSTSKFCDEQLSRNFAKLMAEGKVKAAFLLLSTQHNGAVLHSYTSLGSESNCF